MPPALYWKRWCDSYGLPNEGGWLNQPSLFIREIDAARKGEQRRLVERETSKEDVTLKLLADIRRLLAGTER